jgi:hypothetical protein
MKINLTTQRLDPYTARAVEIIAATVDLPAYPVSGTLLIVEGKRYLTGQVEIAIDATAPSDRVLTRVRCEELK